MKLKDEKLLIKLAVAKSKVSQLVVKRFQYDKYLYINFCQYTEIKGKSVPSKINNFTFAYGYLIEVLNAISEVRINKLKRYAKKVHIVHNSVIDEQLNMLKEYIIDVSKKGDGILYITQMMYNDNKKGYIPKATIELPNKRQLIKRLTNITNDLDKLKDKLKKITE